MEITLENLKKKLTEKEAHRDELLAELPKKSQQGFLKKHALKIGLAAGILAAGSGTYDIHKGRQLFAGKDETKDSKALTKATHTLDEAGKRDFFQYKAKSWSEENKRLDTQEIQEEKDRLAALEKENARLIAEKKDKEAQLVEAKRLAEIEAAKLNITNKIDQVTNTPPPIVTPAPEVKKTEPEKPKVASGISTATVNDIMAELAKAQALNKEMAKKLEEIKSAPAPAPKVETYQEKLAKVRAKIHAAIEKGVDPGSVLNSEEALIWNARPSEPINVGGQTMQIGHPGGGVNTYFRSDAGSMNQGMMNVNNNKSTESFKSSNPYKLSPENLQKVEKIYEDMLDKAFPGGIKDWKKIKDESASKFMDQKESKVKKAQKYLYDYMAKLKTTTGLAPKSGMLGEKVESVERYIARALEYASSKNLLEKLK